VVLEILLVACPDYSAAGYVHKKKRLFCWLSVYERDGGLVYARVSGSRGRKTNLLKLKAAVATLDIRDFYQGSKMSIEGGQLGRYHVCLLSLEPSFPLMGKQSDSVQLNKQKNRRRKKKETLVQVPTRRYVMEQAEEWGGGEGGALVQVVNASMCVYVCVFFFF